MLRPLILGAALALAPVDTATDQYPGDPFAFACDVPPVSLADGATPEGCSLMLTACIDAATGTSCSDAKSCRAAHDQCIAWVDEACWSLVD
jgi:hypothetical protein